MTFNSQSPINVNVMINRVQQDLWNRDLRSFEIRLEFESAVPIRFESDGQIRKFRIGRACPLLVVVKRLKPLMALSGTVYRLATSMSDHTPVLSFHHHHLFNMFEEWNKTSVVIYVSFVLFVINRWLLNARFDSYSVGPSWNMLSLVHTGQLYTLQSPFSANIVAVLVAENGRRK